MLFLSSSLLLPSTFLLLSTPTPPYSSLLLLSSSLLFFPSTFFQLSTPTLPYSSSLPLSSFPLFPSAFFLLLTSTLPFSSSLPLSSSLLFPSVFLLSHSLTLTFIRSLSQPHSPSFLRSLDLIHSLTLNLQPLFLTHLCCSFIPLFSFPSTSYLFPSLVFLTLLSLFQSSSFLLYTFFIAIPSSPLLFAPSLSLPTLLSLFNLPYLTFPTPYLPISSAWPLLFLPFPTFAFLPY